MKQKRQVMLCAMVSSSLVFGMGNAYADNDFSLDQVVVTATRTPVKVSATGANVSIISREQIEQKHYDNITDALRDVNGALVMQQGFPGGEQYVRINGDDRVLVMIDGRRLNLSKLPGSMGKGATYDLNSFPSLDNVERIEIVKGPASSLYGSDAVGGVINIITRKGKENHTTVESAFGSWGVKKNKVIVEGSQKDWSWFLTAGKIDQDHYAYKNFKNGSTVNMDNSEYNQDNITFRLDKDLGDNKSLTFNFEHTNDHKGQPYLPNDWFISNSSRHYSQSYLNTLANNWALSYNYNQNKEEAGHLRVYQNFYQYDSHSYGYDWISGGNAWSKYLYKNKETGFEWQSAWRINNSNVLVGGADWRDITVNYPGTYSDKNITNKALYVEDRMSLGKQWTFSPGVRYDNHSMFGDRLTSRATVNYQIDSTINTYLSWGEVFNAPDADRLFWPDDPSMGYKGNPNLKPETGYTTTIGLNKKLNKDTELKVSAYSSQLKDAIGTVEYAPFMYTPENVGKQKKEGMEIELSQALSTKWHVMAGYTYTKVENKDNSTAAYQAEKRTIEPNAYKLGVSYKQDAWNVELTGRGAAGRSTEYFTSSGYWVWDMAVNYQINKALRSYVKVDNLTNRAYELYGFQSPNQGGFPMTARYYEMGVQYKF